MAKSRKAVLDRKRPYASISSLKPQKAVYEQDGILFDNDGVECGKVAGYEARKQKEAADAARKKKAEAAESDVSAAEAILGDLGVDPDAEARRENQAAAVAENLADDA